MHRTRSLSTLVRAATAVALAVAVVACGGEDPLDTSLDPATNTVDESPAPFEPAEGGIGQGTYEELPYAYLVLTEGALDDVGEDNCGQFSPSTGDLEVSMYGQLQPGTFTVVAGDATPGAGDAHVRFAQGSWTSGSVKIDEGSEERGSTVRGRVEALDETGKRLLVNFEVLFHGCGLD